MQVNTRRLIACLWGAALLAACGPDPATLGDGVVAVVDGAPITARDVAAQRPHLSKFAEMSIGDDPASQAVLTRAVVETTALAVDARARGLDGDARVAFARRELEAGLERRTVVAARGEDLEGAALDAKLRAWIDSHPDDFMLPETRAFDVVVRPDLADARETIARLNAGEIASLDEVGEVVQLAAVARDDQEFPLLHPYVFAAGLTDGSLVPVPVVVERRPAVARIRRVNAPRLPRLDEPGVRQEAREALLADRSAQLMETYLEELRDAAK